MCLPQGEPWRSALRGHELDPVTQQQDQQRLMLERFQNEVRAGRETELLRVCCVWYTAGAAPGDGGAQDKVRAGARQVLSGWLGCVPKGMGSASRWSGFKTRCGRQRGRLRAGPAAALRWHSSGGVPPVWWLGVVRAYMAR